MLKLYFHTVVGNKKTVFCGKRNKVVIGNVSVVRKVMKNKNSIFVGTAHLDHLFFYLFAVVYVHVMIKISI